MSIPLDNLYNWVEGLLPSPCAVYLFYPHGHKDISDINILRHYPEHITIPSVLMHDQEPLNYKLYENAEEFKLSQKLLCNSPPGSLFKQIETINSKLIKLHMPNINLSYVTFLTGSQIYDQVILVHSEKNSNDLEKYVNDGYLCVYYWAHAIIALDWFRFAKFDTKLEKTVVDKKFLIYCRDWSNNREYRLKFLSLLLENQLIDCSKVTMLKINSEGHSYDSYKFNNTDFNINNASELASLQDNNYSSSYSANYVSNDFAVSAISVVLETEFDGSRIHLTEKILRAIACKHPFILAAGPNSLEYLRSYGFKTFEPWIDESYDLEINSATRLEKIINSMKKINNLSPEDFSVALEKINEIAEYNHKRFFNPAFFEQVQDELKEGLKQACRQVVRTKGKKFLQLEKLHKVCNIDLLRNLDLHPYRKELISKIRRLRRGDQ